MNAATMDGITTQTLVMMEPIVRYYSQYDAAGIVDVMQYICGDHR